MDICRKHTNGTHTKLTNVVALKTEYFFNNVHDYYNLIKTKRHENGNYMIKKCELYYIPYSSGDMVARRKTYLCYADAGICFTLKRKDKGIFKCNNFIVICRLAKYLATSNHELISIVDRRSGKETYILNKTQARLKNRIIFVK